jgi:hypothetical protein
MDHPLPAELVQGVSVRDGEYGWEVAQFPAALKIAERTGRACLGGQFQFRFDEGIYEMYWLSADPAERFAGEQWEDYVHRSCTEVAMGFDRLVGTTDFSRIVRELPSDLRDKVPSAELDFTRALVFVAYFVTEQEFVALSPARE